MRVSLIAVGKLKSGPDRDLFDRYWSRFKASGRAIGVTGTAELELPESRAQQTAVRKVDEGQRLLRAAGEGAQIICLDETGKTLTSVELASAFRKLVDQRSASVAILLGGPDGHGDAVRHEANLILSLGRLTLPHGLARIIIAEQLYRATTILAGHPYHRQ